MPITKGKGIAIDDLQWQGVKAHIQRQDTVEGFNYEFLMEVFTPADTSTTKAKTAADTTSAMAFTLGNLHLEDFKITFDDKVTGIDSEIQLGLLEVEMQEFDLDSMRFGVGDATLKNTRFSYLQTKPFPESPNEEAPATPFFSVESLEIDDVVANYQSIPDGFLTEMELDDFLLKLPRANIGEQLVHVEMLGLRNSKVLIKTGAGTPAEDSQEPAAAVSYTHLTLPTKRIV